MNCKTKFSIISLALVVNIQSVQSQCWEDVGFTVMGNFSGISKMSFVDENNGWLLTYATDTTTWISTNYLYKTTNAGENWTNITPQPYIKFYSISFINQNLGWADGQALGSGHRKLYKTNNGGLSWIEMPFPALSAINVYFFSQEMGWCGGTGNKIYRTIDGGNTWTLSIDNLFEVNSVRLKFFDSNHGWITNGGNDTRIWTTTNGGQNWVDAGEINGDGVRDFSFSSASFGITSGDGSQISKTFNGGLTWQNISYTDPSTAGVFCFDTNKFWIGGVNGIAKTSDGGTTWKNFPIDNGNDRIFDIIFFNQYTGFARSINKVFRYKLQLPNCISGFTNPLSFSNIPINTSFLWAQTNDCINGYLVTLKKEDGTPILTDFEIVDVNSFNILPYVDYGMSYSIAIRPYNDYGSALQCNEFQFTTECQTNITISYTPPTCNSNNGSITISDVSGIFGNYQIQWSNGITNTTSIQNLSPGTYQVTVSNNICSVMKEIILANSGIQPTPIIQTPSIISCTNPTIQLNASNSQNATLFSWTAANGGNILSGASTPTPTINSPGNYTLTVFSAGGCSSSTSVFVTSDNSNPIINLNSNNVLTCANNVVMLDASTSTNAVNFLWTTTNGNIVSGANTSTPLVNSPGLYTLQVTATNGCTATATTQVFENKTQPSVSISSNDLTCSNPTAILNAITNASSPSYQWSGPNGFNSVQSMPTITQAGIYYVTVTDGINGCSNSLSREILQNGNLPGAVINSDELNCNNPTVSLSVTSSGFGLTYSWSGPGINASNQNITSPIISTAGQYSVTVTNPATGCSSIGQTIVNQNFMQPIANAGTNYQLQCGSGVTLNGGASVNAISFIWLNANGTTIGNNTGIATQNVSAPGVYSLIVVGINGCKDTAQTIVQGGSFPTNAAVIITDVTCKGKQDGILSVESVTGGVLPYQYALNNGVFKSEKLFGDLPPGTYTLTVKDANGCTFEILNNIITEPFDFFEVAIHVPSSGPLPLNTEIELGITANENIDNFLYTWSGNGLSCTACPNPKITPVLSSIYEVTVTDNNACTASASEYVYVKSETSDESHVITPGNQNGENDVLVFPQLLNGNYPLSELVIFNRWGSTIYTIKPYQNNWRGTNQDGQEMPQGTYFFILYLDKTAGKLIKGDVLVIR